MDVINKAYFQANKKFYDEITKTILSHIKFVAEEEFNTKKEESSKKKFTITEEEFNEIMNNTIMKVQDHIKSNINTKRTTKKNKNGVKRKPTAYNKYVKEQMEKIKKEQPDIEPKNLMKEAAKNWKNEKESFMKTFNPDEVSVSS
jgi:hypothetical protein